MKTIEYRTVDKSEWGEGAWQQEPDKMQWQDEATGYACLIVRNRVGALCGYVGVPEGHPLFGKSDREHTDESSEAYLEKNHELLQKYGGYKDVPEEELEAVKGVHQPNPNYSEIIEGLDCHGGVTFTGKCRTATKDEWEKWREYMLRGKHEIEHFPRGDMAESWREDGHLVDDYEAWVKHQEASTICHLTEPGDPEVTWIGFDCSHAGDYMPQMEATMSKIMPDRKSRLGEPLPWGGFESYKDISYVQDQCRQLAQQLKAVAADSPEFHSQ